MILLGSTKVTGVTTIKLSEIITLSEEDMQLENLEIAERLETGEVIYKEIGTNEYLVKGKFIHKETSKDNEQKEVDKNNSDKELMKLYFTFIKDTGLLFSKHISLKENTLVADLRHNNIKAIKQVIKLKNRPIIKTH